MTGPQYGHVGQHHGIGTPECPTDLHHHHDERCEAPAGLVIAPGRECPTCGTVPTPIPLPAADRLDRAYRAFGELADSGGPGMLPPTSLIAAVEAARTVHVDEALAMIFEAAADTPTDGNDVPAGLRAVFEALGLRVVES